MVPEWNYFMGVVRILKGAVSDLFPGFFISRSPLDNYFMLTPLVPDFIGMSNQAYSD